MAQTDCVMGSPQISLPSCMEKCFVGAGCGGCPCANNLKGWCEMGTGDGPDSWFARWGLCVLGACPNDGDITNLMLLYVAQCDGTVGGPLNNDTVPYPLRDWAPKAPQYLSQSTAASSTATSSMSRSVATLTGVAPSATANPGSTTVSTNRSDAAVLDNATSTFSSTSSTTTSASETQSNSRPALSVAAIIGIAVGGTALLVLIVGSIAFILRRRRRKEHAVTVSPPSYEVAESDGVYDKPELDSQVLVYQHSKAGVGAPMRSPVAYAELDGCSPVSLARELPDRS